MVSLKIGHMPMEIIHLPRKMGSIDQQLLAGLLGVIVEF
jgi:hypothetical protein